MHMCLCVCLCLCGCVGNNKSQGKGAINFSVREHGKSWMKRARDLPEGGFYKKGKLGDSILIEDV